MYYFCDSPKSISNNFIPNNLSGIVSFKNFALCATFNSSQLLIFENKTTSLIGYYERSVESIEVYGKSTDLEWNSDGSQIAIITENGFLLFFLIKLSCNESIGFEKEITYSKEGFMYSTMLLNAEISLQDIINFNSKIACLCFYRDDLLVAVEDGTLSRIRWDGTLLYNQEVKLTNISFFSDLEFSKASKLARNEAICRSIEWFPSLSGVIILLLNGKSAFLHIPNHKLLCEQITGVWAEYLRHATSIAVNVKFRSVAYGLKMGEAVIYKTEEETGAFRMQHRLKILCNEYPDADKITGAVTSLKWSPDNFCLALCWENKGFSLWTVHGSLLFSSLGNRCGIEMNLSSLTWGCEGYSLWAVKKPDKYCSKPKIYVFQMAKSALMLNPTKDNHQHLLLLASTYIIIGSRKSLSSSLTNLEYVHYPETYISSNWPIKYACIDMSGSRLIVSGKCGFAIYFLASKKWRLFGNETQEHSFEVSGGMVWYKHIVCLACFDNKEEKFEIRLYNSLIKIDNSLSFNYPISAQVLIMNIFDNTLVTLSIDGFVSLYEIKIQSDLNTLSLEFLQVISLENYIEFAACVVSFNLTSLHTELNKISQNVNDPVRYQSLLINYSGHVLMFQRDTSSSGLRNTDQVVKSKENFFSKLTFRDTTQVKHDIISFNGPLVVAYNVEIMWTPLIYEEDCSKGSQPIDWDTKMYTMENALWLNCGAHGLRVWLPLNGNHTVTGNEKKTKLSFLSKRIMLTCKISNFYPLVVLNNEGLLMSPMNEFSLINVDSPSCQSLPFANITKNRHIFLQHIIKELLRINLGIYALDLTVGLKKLPYFNHSLELLLHEVLEEEATSKEPIPDPLLPRVVAFIQEFPNFLRTIVQCARKTELALWSYLFESAGNPKDLFESCLMSNELDTAASYLIILQNIEHPMMSQKHAICLLESALNQSNWSLVRNLIRFLKNIVQDIISSNFGNSDNNSHNSSDMITAINEFKIIENSTFKSSKDSIVPPLSYISRRRYRSGVMSIAGSRQYTTVKNNKDTEKLKINKSSVNQCKGANPNSNVDESSSEEFVTDSVGQKQNSVISPTILNVENDNSEEIISMEFNQNIGSTKNKNPSISDENFEQNSHMSPKGNCSECFDTLSVDCPKNCYLEREVEIILTKFSQKQFKEYRLHNFIDFFVNLKFSETQLVSWMVRERSSCYKIDNPVQAFLRMHDDFNWPLHCTSKKDDQYLNYDSGGLENGVNHFQVLVNDVNISEDINLNKRKLRYFVNILIKANYWEWIFVILLMLEEYDEIISLFQYFTLNINNVEKMPLLSDVINFINIIISWNIEEETKYASLAFQIKMTLVSLFEEKVIEIRDQKLNLSSSFTTTNRLSKIKVLKEDLLILSPVTKHSPLALGQLIIDTVNIEQDPKIIDLSNPEKQQVLNKQSITQISDKQFLKNGLHNYVSKERSKNSVKESPNAQMLRNAYNISQDNESINFRPFDSLVSTELDDQPNKSNCLIS